jgi:hypothetical protein
MIDMVYHNDLARIPTMEQIDSSTMIVGRPYEFSFSPSANATISVMYSRVPPTEATTAILAPDSTSDFAPYYRKLSEIRTTESSDRDDEHPTDASIAFATVVLDAFRQQDLIPTRVVTSAEGGVAICVVRGGKYSDIECLNTGTILGVNSAMVGIPDVWEIQRNLDEIDLSVARIKEFVGR